MHRWVGREPGIKSDEHQEGNCQSERKESAAHQDARGEERAPRFICPWIVIASRASFGAAIDSYGSIPDFEPKSNQSFCGSRRRNDFMRFQTGDRARYTPNGNTGTVVQPEPIRLGLLWDHNGKTDGVETRDLVLLEPDDPDFECPQPEIAFSRRSQPTVE